MAKSGKTKKALLKRVKITGSKKILKRHPHQGHFNAKESRNKTRQKRGYKNAPKSLVKSSKALISRYM